VATNLAMEAFNEENGVDSALEFQL